MSTSTWTSLSSLQIFHWNSSRIAPFLSLPIIPSHCSLARVQAIPISALCKHNSWLYIQRLHTDRTNGMQEKHICTNMQRYPTIITAQQYSSSSAQHWLVQGSLIHKQESQVNIQKDATRCSSSPWQTATRSSPDDHTSFPDLGPGLSQNKMLFFIT